MSETVTVEYLGHTPDLTLRLPYLSKKVTFADEKNRTAEMLRHEAERLVEENPNGFRLVNAQPTAGFEPVFSDEGAEGNPETSGEEKQDSENGAEPSMDEALAMAESYLQSLPDNQAIVQFVQDTYGVGDLNPRRKTANLIKDALDGIAGVMESGATA